MRNSFQIEQSLHGRRWGAVHDGYFSSPAIAQPLIRTAMAVLKKTPADVVVDLGGGTGFLLSQLTAHGLDPQVTRINLDCSKPQLGQIVEDGIVPCHAAIGDFQRRDVATKDRQLFLLMRSVLHYFGQDGLQPLLRHLHAQTRDGEFFVHQSACFDRACDAACLNALYRQLRTPKWFPTTAGLRQKLADSGWRVINTRRAPPLRLTSAELGRRYACKSRDLARLRDRMVREFGETEHVFRLTPSGFHAHLHYRIFTCIAEPSSLSDIREKYHHRFCADKAASQREIPAKHHFHS